MRKIIWIALAFFAATPCLPAMAGTECDAGDGPAAALLTPDLDARPVIDGLSMALNMAHEAADFPLAQIAELGKICPRGTAQLSYAPYSLFGKADAHPARWLERADGVGALYVVAAMPAPDAAPRISGNADKGWVQPDDMMWVLMKMPLEGGVLSAASPRIIFRLYAAIPQDAQLIADVEAIDRGEILPLGAYDPTSQQTLTFTYNRN